MPISCSARSARHAHREPLNSAVMLNPNGDLIDRYDKINLVPFGEYVPKFFGFVNRITQEAGDFVPGNRIVDFPDGRSSRRRLHLLRIGFSA